MILQKYTKNIYITDSPPIDTVPYGVYSIPYDVYAINAVPYDVYAIFFSADIFFNYFVFIFIFISYFVFIFIFSVNSVFVDLLPAANDHSRCYSVEGHRKGSDLLYTGPHVFSTSPLPKAKRSSLKSSLLPKTKQDFNIAQVKLNRDDKSYIRRYWISSTSSCYNTISIERLEWKVTVHTFPVFVIEWVLYTRYCGSIYVLQDVICMVRVVWIWILRWRLVTLWPCRHEIIIRIISWNRRSIRNIGVPIITRIRCTSRPRRHEIIIFIM